MNFENMHTRSMLTNTFCSLCLGLDMEKGFDFFLSIEARRELLGFLKIVLPLRKLISFWRRLCGFKNASYIIFMFAGLSKIYRLKLPIPDTLRMKRILNNNASMFLCDNFASWRSHKSRNDFLIEFRIIFISSIYQQRHAIVDDRNSCVHPTLRYVCGIPKDDEGWSNVATATIFTVNVEHRIRILYPQPHG